MFDQNTLNQLHSNYLATQQSAQKTAPQTPKKKGNFLTSLLPSVGGIAGGAGGGALGGALAGSAILPGIGTAAGGLIGALLGGAAGGAGGKVAENKMEGKSLGSGVLGAGVENGVLSAGPLRLVKGLGVTGKVLLNPTAEKAAVSGIGGGIADGAVGRVIKGSRVIPDGTGGKIINTNLNDAVATMPKVNPLNLGNTTEPNKLVQAINAGGQAAKDMSFTKALGSKLSSSGEGLIAKEFRLSPTQQANFKNLHGEEAVSVLRKYGIKRPEDLQKQIQPLQNAFDGVVDKIPTAGKQEVQQAIQKVYEPLLKSPVLTRQQLGGQLKSQADEILAKSGDQMSAADLNTLRRSFDDAVTYTQRGTNEYTVNKKSADAIRQLLQSKADAAGVKVDGKTFKDVGLELRKLHNLDDIVGKQSYLGTGSLPASLPNLLGAAAGGSAGGGPLGGALGLAGTIAMNSGAGRRAVASTALKTGEKLTAKAETANPYGATGIASRIAPVGLAGALLNQSSGLKNTQPSTDMTMNSSSQPNAANIPELSQNTQHMSSNDPFDPSNVRASVQKIIAQGGKPKDVSDFVSLASALQSLDSKAQTNTPKLNSTQQQQASNAQSALDSLATIQQALQKNPNASKLAALPGGSFTQNITGTGTYSAALANATDVIGRLRSGGAINADEEKRFKSFLPSAFDKPDTVNYKLNSLATLFQKFINPQAAQPDNSSLVSALSGA